MRLTKTRLTTLVGGLLGLAVATFGAVASAPVPQASTTRSFLVTLFGWPDNSPTGNAIAYPKDGGYPAVHNVASGTGTYSDPITFATDKSELPIGTIVYYPYLRRYFIMEDDCTECDQDWTGHGPDGGPGLYHIDLWVGGQNGNSADVMNCENNLTQNSAPVIINPPSNEPVDTAPLYDSSTNTCYNPSSHTGPLVNLGTGRCLDDTNWSTSAWTQMQIWDCTRGANQSWTLESSRTIQNSFSKLCLDVYANSSSQPPVPAIQYGCNSSDQAQVFTLTWTSFPGLPDGYEITNDHGMCLDVHGGWAYNGNTVGWYPCNRTGAQDWNFNFA